MGIEVDEGPTNNEFIEESRQDDDGKVKQFTLVHVQQVTTKNQVPMLQGQEKQREHGVRQELMPF